MGRSAGGKQGKLVDVRAQVPGPPPPPLPLPLASAAINSREKQGKEKGRREEEATQADHIIMDLTQRGDGHSTPILEGQLLPDWISLS
ncbi:hypothetical protein GUJ93_ZPchr0014g46653 [Zizania palustris]|uniref:Uncharacterized protein n=1 Tax=Zizania palustris TaxID=103762 RepID=A0A8J5W0W4_ZIZPA|nr:hypothetical protein GUJ93_ZPchr0014g46653 [Zizania palustris]